MLRRATCAHARVNAEKGGGGAWSAWGREEAGLTAKMAFAMVQSLSIKTFRL